MQTTAHMPKASGLIAIIACITAERLLYSALGASGHTRCVAENRCRVFIPYRPDKRVADVTQHCFIAVHRHAGGVRDYCLSVINPRIDSYSHDEDRQGERLQSFPRLPSARFWID